MRGDDLVDPSLSQGLSLRIISVQWWRHSWCNG